VRRRGKAVAAFDGPVALAPLAERQRVSALVGTHGRGWFEHALGVGLQVRLVQVIHSSVPIWVLLQDQGTAPFLLHHSLFVELLDRQITMMHHQ